MNNTSKAFYFIPRNFLGLGLLLLSFVAIDSQAQNETPKSDQISRYPAHWWAPVPPETAKKWEILPQSAGSHQVVLSKRNELGAFSNFANVSFVLDGVCYPTLEAFWQMVKYPETADDPRHQWSKSWRYTRQQVALMNGYSAKAAGNYANFLMEKNNSYWITYQGQKLGFGSHEDLEHFELILRAFHEKYRQNPQIQELLTRTEGLELLADHGISEKAPFQWHYHKMWMKIRDDVSSGKLSLKTQEDLSLKTCKSIDIEDLPK